MKSNFVTLFSVAFFVLLFSFATSAQNGNKEPAGKKQQQDRPLKITSKPQISRDVLSKCLKGSRNTQLVTVLTVTFHSSGKVTNAEISQDSGCEYLDKESIRAAAKIKFKPAVKNGELITVTKNLEYKAGIY